MRIDGPGRPTTIAPTGKAPRAGGSGSGFSLEEEAPAARSGSVSQTASLAGLTGVLALQEAEDPLVRKRRAVRRGHTMLDRLEELRIALIDGTVTPLQLDQMTMLLATRESTGDERLEALIDEIELRLQVELAKQGRFPG